MAHQDWPFNRKFRQCRVQHLSLHFHRDGPMIGAFAVTVAGTIKSDSAISARDRSIKPRPIVTRSGIAMNQHDRPSFALHHKVQVSVVDLHKERIGARMVMGHTPQKPDISPTCNDKAWRIDVGMSKFYGGPIEVLELRGDAAKVLKEDAK